MSAAQKERTQPGGAGSQSAHEGIAGDRDYNRSIDYSLGFGPYDNSPEQRSAANADEFVDAVIASVSHKKGELWLAGPCALAPDDDRHRENPLLVGKPHRCKACAQPRKFVGLDVDSDLTAESASALVELLQAYAGVVYPTANSSDEAPRLRGIVVTERALTRDELKLASAGFRAMIDRQMIERGYPPPGWDESCDRAEQPLYTPTIGAWIRKLEGEPLCVASLLPARDLLHDGVQPQATVQAPVAHLRVTRDRYANAALLDSLDNIAAAAPGSRNEVANREGYALGGFVGAGRLDEDVVISTLLDATVAAGWDNPSKTESTIRSAVASGKLAPRHHGLQDAVLFAMAPTHLPAANDETWQGPNGPSSAQLADVLSRELTPPSDEEWEAAAQPDPHVFGDGESGLFPVGEVAVLGAPQRSGKTTLVVHLAAHIALGLPVVGLPCNAGRVVIYSREDDRKQYTRKIRAACCCFSPEQDARVRMAIITPNMRAPGLREASMLIDICERRRRPIETAMVDALIAALRPLVECDDPVRLVVFETVSTLSHAEEDNKGLSALAAALKKVAQDLRIAILVTHHLSQEGSKELRTLNLSTNMIRGATALVGDTRQSLLQIDLGSDGDPLPKNDQREVFRRFLTQRPFDPHRAARFSALVPMDTSKARDPLPLFTAWIQTPFGPAMDAVSVPETIAGERWRKAQGAVSAWGDVQKAKAKGEKKDVTASAEMQALLDAYDKTINAAQVPTANAISKHIGRSMGWVQTRLSSAVELGVMKSSVEQVHRGPKEGTVVYRRVDGDCGSN